MAFTGGQLVPTNLPTLLLAIQAQAMASTGFPQERVIIWSKEKELWHSQGDQYIRIRPRSQMSEPCIIGGGRWSPLVTRKVNVCLWGRLNVDSFDNDQSLMTDPNLGFLTAEHALFNALLNFHAQDPNSAGMLCEPLKLGPVKNPSNEMPATEWASSEADFDVTFVLSLATPASVYQ